MVMDSDIENLFQEAVLQSRYLSKVSQSDMLKLYGLYKQSNEGCCNIPKPAFWDFAGKAKWESWNSYRKLSKKDAQLNYVTLVNALKVDNEGYNENCTTYQKEGLGVSVSTMAKTDEEEINDENKTIFHYCEEGNLKYMINLLDTNPLLLNEKDKDDLSLLHWAVDRGHSEIVEFLISRGCNVNCVDSDLQTPLHYAVTCGRQHIVELLVSNGADVKLKDIDGRSALVYSDDIAITKIAEMGPSLKVLEFYSGIGGVHYALTYAGVSAHVEAAFEINTSANSVYKHNFPQTTLLQKNIEGLNLEDLEHLNADVWTMSPPCQPYTRLGKQEASCDPRAKSFKKLMNILVKMTSPPSFIFLENVKGFEVSDSCEDFLMILNSKGYYTQSFLLSPVDFGIPNSRLRYYLIARYQKKFNFKTTQKPICLNGNLCECEGLDMECACTVLASVVQLYKPMKIKDILNVDNSVSSEINSSSFCEPGFKKMLDLLQKRSFPLKFTKISHSILLRYYSLFDIVDSDSNKSCCFTSGYSRFIEGTGSLFSCLPQSDRNLILNKLSITKNDNESNIDLLESLQLRFFSPEEIAALLCFPICFSFPDKITEKQKYKLLGNSVNVLVVANVMRFFLFENKI